jgi:hypothetical protein
VVAGVPVGALVAVVIDGALATVLVGDAFLELPQPLATTASTTHALMTRELTMAQC